MARKAAPQPLALPDAARTSSGEHPHDPRTGETRQQIQSPTSASSPRSPRSPRSPFRFSPKRSAASVDRGKQSVQPAEDVHPQQQHEQQASQDQRQRQRQQQHNSPSPSQNQTRQQRSASGYEDAESPYLPLAATLHQVSIDSPSPSSSQTHHRQQTIHKQQQFYEDEPEPSRSPKSSGFFFSFHKPSKSTQQLSTPSSSTAQFHPSSSNLVGDTAVRGAENNPAMPSKTSSSRYQDSSYADHSVQKPTPSLPSKSDLSLASAPTLETSSPQQNTPRKAKPKGFGILSRTKSVRDKDDSSPRGPRDPATPPAVQAKTQEPQQQNTAYSYDNAGPRTAPVQRQDRFFRDMMVSSERNRSESRDRSAARNISQSHGQRDPSREKDQRLHPSSFRDNGGSLLSGLKNSSTRAADMIRGGLFGKGSRSGSTTENQSAMIDDEHYEFQIINLPLVEQTQATRISPQLEKSNDKTEFWMPALPWRAIDYLNYKGCDVEGLYRVPGSGPQVKKWQRRFDERRDVDLFAQDDLYDINIIGSMLKAWLRELPDELFPKEAQERVARECAGAETVPQLLIDELSNLPPYNYYLLFAITCHLSLLLAHADKNKMDFRNLCICFQPCMKIDAFSFKFLVCDWRDCWRGCKNEAKYIEQEYRRLKLPTPHGLAEPRPPVHEELREDRNVSSSDSSKQSSQDGQKPRLKKKALPQPEYNGSAVSAATPATPKREPNLPTNVAASSALTLPPLSPMGLEFKLTDGAAVSTQSTAAQV